MTNQIRTQFFTKLIFLTLLILLSIVLSIAAQAPNYGDKSLVEFTPGYHLDSAAILFLANEDLIETYCISYPNLNRIESEKRIDVYTKYSELDSLVGVTFYPITITYIITKKGVTSLYYEQVGTTGTLFLNGKAAFQYETEQQTYSKLNPLSTDIIRSDIDWQYDSTKLVYEGSDYHQNAEYIDEDNLNHSQNGLLSLLIGDTIITTEGMKILPIEEEESVWLPYLEEELKKYPKGLLEEYKVKIFLVAHILPKKEDRYFFPLGYRALGSYELSDEGNYVYLVPYEGVRETLHHELNSVLIKVKMERDSEFKKLVERYCGYFESVSNYTEKEWETPLYNHEVFLGPNHYAQTGCENDMNTIAEYLFVPLKYFDHEGKDYMLEGFMNEALKNEYPVLKKIFYVEFIYEAISPEFTSDYFYDFIMIKIDDIPLEYSSKWEGKSIYNGYR